MKGVPHNSYDVIIIGAGSVGAPTALFLAQAGLKVLVLDQYASVGQGSNKKAIGGIRATHSDPAKIALCLRSIDIFSNWQALYGDNIEWFQGGYSFVAYNEEEEKTLKEILAKQKALGLTIDWYAANDLLQIIPDLNPHNLRGGTYSPLDGSASPLLAIHAFYERACQLGVIFKFNEQVTDFIIKSDRVEGVLTTQNTYFAPVVIHAAGAWARSIAQKIHLDLPVYPDSHESAITEPVARFLNPMVVDIRPMTGSSNFYFYQHITGQIVFCLTPSPAIWGDFTEETSTFLPMVAQRLLKVMPRLQNLRVRRAWRGLYPMTPDGSPLIGWINEVPGLLLAVGMCGQGFMLGPGLGELLTRIVTRQLTAKDQEVLQYLSPYRQFSVMEKLK